MSVLQLSPLLLLLCLPALVSAVCEVLPQGSPCSCQFHDGKSVINCKRQGLTQVPQFNDDGQVYDELTLSGNDITRLEDNDFSVLNVRKLDLSGNDVTVIQGDAFAGLNSHLKELILHVDGLTGTQFPTQALSALTSLETLSLQGFNMGSFPAGALAQLTSLRELHAQSCNLQQLEAGDLEAQRNTLRVLDLGLNMFQTIPGAVGSLRALNNLVLTGNKLNTLQVDAFKGVSVLRELDLSQNSIQQIQIGAFNGLEGVLQVLRMHHCLLQQQQLAPMSGLRELLNLDLAHNSIAGIDTGFFHDMSKLQELNFEGNGILELTTTTFAGLGGSLQILNLENNGIGSIQANAFAVMDWLETLLLGSQSRSLSGTLDKNTFNGLKDTLQTLGLAGVGFSDVDWASVNELQNLRSLDLRSNAIRNIPDSTFLEMQVLETLQLAGNQLRTLTQQGMRGPEQSLATLKLDDNNINVIDHCVFADFKSLSSLDLYDNPLQCDCQLRWLREWAEGQDSVQWVCDSPSEHKGDKFMDLGVADFTCSGGDQLPECEDFTPTTSKPTPQSTQAVVPQPVHVEVSNTTDSAVHISWSVYGAYDVKGFSITYFILGEEENVQYQETDKYARSYTLEELESATGYYICVAVIDSNPDTDPDYTCVDAKTEPTPKAVEEDTNSTAIIVAAILGAVFVIAVIIIILCLVRRCSKQPEDDLGGFSMSDAPKLGYASKRFSKPTSTATSVQNLDNEQLEKKLDGFSPEERDKIINLLTHSGASTLSMISNADSQRYVPEPPPLRQPQQQQQGAEGGYMNPVDLKDENFYFEIPDDDENYDQIPGDKVQTVGRPVGSVYI